MEGKNIPLIIMLTAGSIISIACIVYDFTFMETLCIVLGTLVVFYLLGLIVKKIILTINRNAEERAALLESQKEEEKAVSDAEKAEVEGEDVTIERDASAEAATE